MNKTKNILAISCLGLMATSAAKVIEDKLEVYGKAHLAVENYSPDIGTGTTDLKSIDSRIGFKGKLPLDGSLKTVYKYEFGVDIADESTSSDGKDFFKNRS